MKPYFLLSFLFLCSVWLSAQPSQANLITFSAPAPLRTGEVLQDLPAFGLPPGHQLHKQYEHTGADGLRHVKYHQYYRGRRILNATIIFHLNARGQVVATNGRLAGFTTLELKPGLPSVTAAQRAVEIVVAQEKSRHATPLAAADLRVPHTSSVIVSQGYPKPGGQFVPAYQHTVKAVNPALPVNTTVLINARNGQVIAAISNIHSTTVTGTGSGLQNRNVAIEVDSVSANRYEMHDKTRGLGVLAYDLLYEQTPFDEDNVWDNPAEAAAAMVDGYYGSLKFYDFLQDKFGRNSLDDAGVPLVSNFNLNNYVNAFWDGESATYGNGNCENYQPLTTLDVVGHEFAHGLTQYTSGLIYQDESGALNESISDILGKALEYEVTPGTFNWKIGAALRRNPGVNFFRAMDDPEERGHPKLYRGNNWRTGPGDAGGVHSNSGVFNFWFYLLVEGGRSVNEIGDRYNVAPIGWENALQLVYLLEAAYLTESSGYPEAYELSLAAATALFGADSPDYAAVVNAWKAVGLPAAPDHNGGNPVALNFISTPVNPGATFDFRFCPAELAGLSITFLNDSDSTIHRGATLSGEIIFSSFGEAGPATDTLTITNRLLTEDLGPGEEINLPAPYPGSADSEFLSVASTLHFSAPGDLNYRVTSSNFIFLNVLEELELNFFNADYSSPCGSDQFLENDFYSIGLPRCAGGSTGTIRIIYASPDDAVFLERTLEDETTSALTFFNPFAEADVASLGNLNQVTLRIVHFDGDTETLLYEEPLYSRFANTFSSPASVDFTDTLRAQYDLAIRPGTAVVADYPEGKLRLRNDNDFPVIPACIPLRDYSRMLSRNEARELTTISLCVDAASIENPHLTFDLQLLDNPAHSFADNAYLHLVSVYADSTALLDTPISSTGVGTQTFELPLAPGFSGEIMLQVAVNGTTAFLDNIGIRSGTLLSTRLPEQHNFGIAYGNPVTHQLEVRSDRDLPAGSTITLFTGAGRAVRQVPAGLRRTTLDVSLLPGGIYFLAISDGRTFRWTGKVVRMH